jgi:hypothetical protein
MPERKTTTKKTAAKATSRKTTTRARKRTPLTQDQIAERAYHLWLDGGADPVANWLTAERELATA